MCCRRGSPRKPSEGEGDTRVRDERRLADALPDQLRVELHPDEEQVEGEPDLCGRSDQRHDVRREEVLHSGRLRRAASGRAGSRRAPRPSPRLAELAQQEPPSGAPRGSRPRSRASGGRTSSPGARPARRGAGLGQLGGPARRDLLFADRARKARALTRAGDGRGGGRPSGAGRRRSAVVVEPELAAGAAAVDVTNSPDCSSANSPARHSPPSAAVVRADRGRPARCRPRSRS